MKKITNLIEVPIAILNNEDFILSKENYEILLRSNRNTVFGKQLKEHIKNHKIVIEE